jgi:hypothetical protein
VTDAMPSGACFLHGLKCRHIDPNGVRIAEETPPFGGGEDSRSRGSELHPYLGNILELKLCTPCTQRVRFTREALREQGPPVKRHDKIAEWNFASLAGTHTEDAFVTDTDDPRTETVCVVCSQETVFCEDMSVSEMRSCTHCPLSWHVRCAELAHFDGQQDGPCIYCVGKESLSDVDRGRMFARWGRQAVLEPDDVRLAPAIPCSLLC